jgi:16S rRNA C967 or C1407 C5-methylase (RsmB/RsmF family)/NOL1/NOP2/fmu family ribosome biogenesis protein
LADRSAKGFFILNTLPKELLQSLEGVEGFNREAFERVHSEGKQVTSIRVNPLKEKIETGKAGSYPELLKVEKPVPWSQYGYYLEKRPSFTFDPLFHAGLYYVQEASSMFLEQALRQLGDLSSPLKVLDLCAAPGGKSTHIQSLLSKESLLVSNEVIRGRSNILTDNIIKWGAANVAVTNNDPAAFGKLEGYFDVIVVDAPCSGSGLFRKDEEAISEWSWNNVQLCSQRQQRILADVLPSLKENGLLIYSTCSYSSQEDEDIADWLVTSFAMENLVLDIPADWNIITSTSKGSQSKGYRFYPDKLMGEGFFLSCFRKKQVENEAVYRPVKTEKASTREKSLIQPWLKVDSPEIIKEGDLFYGLPESLAAQYALLKSLLNIRYAGIVLGRIMKERLVPEHALAMSILLEEHIPVNELRYEEAIKYLQRQDLQINTTGKGWQLVSYAGHHLGWINVLPNRVNNYYPKELRILKQTNDTSFEKY